MKDEPLHHAQEGRSLTRYCARCRTLRPARDCERLDTGKNVCRDCGGNPEHRKGVSPLVRWDDSPTREF